MQKFLLRLLIAVICISIIATFSLIGCKEEATPAKEAVKETTEEEVEEEEVDITLMHDKGGTPNFQPYFEAVGEKTKELLNVSVTPVPYPSTDVFMAAVRSTLPTDEAPDLFTWWSTYQVKELIDQDLVAETTNIWDNHKDEYSQGLRDVFTFDGEVYGYCYGVEYWPVWYNKDRGRVFCFSITGK